MNIHTHVVSAGHSACQGLITLRVVQLEYSPVSIGHRKILQERQSTIQKWPHTTFGQKGQ